MNASFESQNEILNLSKNYNHFFREHKTFTTQNILINVNERIRYVMTMLHLKEKIESVNFPVGVDEECKDESHAI